MDPLQPLLDSLAKPAALYVLVGSEGLLVRNAEEAVRKAVLTGATAAFNDAVLTSGEESAASFVDIARQLPMMAGKRLVVLRQIQEANVALLEQLLTYAAAPVPSTVLVVVGEKMPAAAGGVDRGLRIINAAKKSGFVLKLDGDGVDPAGFALAQAKELGVRMDKDAAALLASLIGAELSVIAAEVEKCAGYAGKGGTIDRSVVETLCVNTAETEVWALTNALVARDRNRALEALQRLLDDGEAPHKLLASVVWQLRQLLVVQDCTARGISEREANLRIHPGVLRSIKETITKAPVRPSTLLEELASTNRAMNSSRAGDRRVFEGLVLRLTVL